VRLRKAVPSVSHSDAPLAPSELASLLGPFLFRQPGNDRPAVLAVSGGPDSTLLLRGAAGLRPFGEVLPLVTATVDHGLRPESAAEAEQVAAWSEAIGIPHRTLRWHGEKPRSGLQEAAREARYSLLAELARDIGAARVLTAHTLDDQAETMLMRLARGSGLSGLRGMAAETHLQGIVLARPLLGIRRSRILATCREQNWPFFEDPSNEDEQFTRVRLRRRLLPQLAPEGITPERLAILARRLRRADEALALRAKDVLQAILLRRVEAEMIVNGTALQAEPEEIRLRVLALCLEMVSGPAFIPRLERLERAEARLVEGLATGRRCRVSLGGALLTTAPDGTLGVRPEPMRRRGHRTPISEDDACPPHSLGNAGSHAYFANIDHAGEGPPSTPRGRPNR
jgi:tRNA(Ile)-lysidine synthase